VLLIVDEKRGFSKKIPSGGAEELLGEPLFEFCNFIQLLKVA
jgi:hypothetical protein